MHLSRLRLYGFKSFSDKTEVLIEPGLNGIIGPNGCGKSNLVEALRWVMGGASAKNFRATDMDDVIFAGTSKRASRNLAEVSLLLDNSDNSAPHPFQNVAQIEVTRRIEREKGSTYLVNGKVVRARDVEMLFADALTGSSSPALVSQGKVAQLINAKPSDRREVLIEAAGVSALFARRHEAQLRLKAASENLEKLDVVLHDLDNQTATLRRQAKQAEKYAELNTFIRNNDMALLWYAWHEARDAVKRAEAAFQNAENTVRDALVLQTRANTEAANHLESLPALRNADAAARAALQKLVHTAENIKRESDLRDSAISDLTDQLTRIVADVAFATSEQEQTAAQIIELQTIDAELAQAATDYPAQIAALVTAQETQQNATSLAQAKVLNLTMQKQALAKDIAANANAKQVATNKCNQLESQQRTLSDELAALRTKRAELGNTDDVLAKRNQVTSDLTAAEEALHVLQTALDAARAANDADQVTLTANTTRHAHITSEINAVNHSLKNLSSTKIAGSLLLGADVAAGYERALARAAGCAGMQAGDQGDSSWQVAAHAAQALPDGTVALAKFVTAPEKLSAFLNSVGVVDTLAQANAIFPLLRQGQILVTKDGWLWRWDGLVLSPDYTEDQSHVVLEYRTRLAALNHNLQAAEAEVKTAQAAKDAAAKNMYDQQAVLQTNQQTIRQLRAALQTLDADLSRLTESSARLGTMEATLTERLRGVVESYAAAQTELAGFTDATNDALQSEFNVITETLNAAEHALTDSRAALHTTINTLSDLRAKQAQIINRQADIARDIQRIAGAQAGAANRSTELATRHADIAKRLQNLRDAAAADNTAMVLEGLRERIVDATAQAASVGETLQVAENNLGQLNAAARAADLAVADAREARGGTFAAVESARDKLALVITDIHGRFDCDPQTLEGEVTSIYADGVPPRADVKRMRDEASRAREAIGPVNLQAATELETALGQQGNLANERADLAAAIARLHDAINTLNGEARTRLQDAFDTINTHFQTLFQRLFAGGEARLELVGDDILDAGLEIFAQPPGKALQSLRLLSGGEQALTALTLIFAMFACNPAPVCVLDEVDAPLDDANIERLCGVLDEMSKRFTTRFLVITHHRLTMARMQRLYGVTMAERGVSQLVGVDLDLMAKVSAEGDAIRRQA